MPNSSQHCLTISVFAVFETEYGDNASPNFVLLPAYISLHLLTLQNSSMCEILPTMLFIAKKLLSKLASTLLYSPRCINTSGSNAFAGSIPDTHFLK